jgi:hypothetical protein
MVTQLVCNIALKPEEGKAKAPWEQKNYSIFLHYFPIPCFQLATILVKSFIERRPVPQIATEILS